MYSKYFPLGYCARLTGQNTIFPLYHTVTDQVPIHIKHLYTPRNIQAFENDLDYFLKHFEVRDLYEIKDQINNPRRRKKPGFLLTFDDGLWEFYEVVAPILIKKGIPAICFLNPSFVDNRGLFYRYKVSLLLDKCTKNPSIIDKNEVKAVLAKMVGKTLKDKLLQLNHTQIHLIDHLAQLINIDFDQYLHEKKPYMTLEMIQSLHHQGFYFGGHSLDHPLYNLLDIETQWHQTMASIAWVCEKLDLDYRIFSFPFTDYNVTLAFLNKLNQANPKVDLIFGTAGLKKELHPFHLQRIPMEISRYDAPSILTTEYIYYLFKSMVGKNKLYRNETA